MNFQHRVSMVNVSGNSSWQAQRSRSKRAVPTHVSPMVDVSARAWVCACAYGAGVCACMHARACVPPAVAMI